MFQLTLLIFGCLLILNIQLINKIIRTKSTPYLALPDIPDAPGTPTASETGEYEITVTWTAPPSDGGARILGYKLEKQDTPSGRWSMVTMEKISELTYTLTGLREGQELTFRAYAENKAGLSEPSQPSKPIKVRRPYGKDFFLQFFFF